LGLIFSFLFYFLVFLISFKSPLKSKVTSFERGFVGVGKIQNAFSIHFFLIIVIFVIFDLEVIIFIRLIASSFYRGLLFLIF
jgi:NADH:ubiquinone oxidoreductase subunit 3 (subunit A)